MKALLLKIYSLQFTGNIFFLLSLIFCSTSLFAQSERLLVREGNKLYKEKKYSDAEVSYKKSLNAKKGSPTGQFNLGDAYYKQGKYDEAASQFQSLSEDKSIDKEEKSRAYHNLGNSFLQSKKYEESINAFKNALKLNSKDNDTRYNLAYAQSMLQQQQQKEQNKDNKDKQDQKKDQQQQQQKQDEQKKDQQQQQQQKQAEQKQKISKEDAEKILQALNNDEKNTQKKFVKKESARISIEKNW
jgi:Ca-activated chloride channel family protein